jgi:imidazolonepropionase-like amidohydrolase
MKFITSLLTLFLCHFNFSQIPQPTNGVALNKQNNFRIIHVNIYVSPTKTIENGSVVIRNGRIESVESKSSDKTDLPIVDAHNGWIVASFIELNSSLGIAQPEARPVPTASQNSGKKGPYYWNESIHPEVNPSELYVFNQTETQNLQKMGFGLVLTHQNDGIAQGSGTIVKLGSKPTEQFEKVNFGGFYSFEKGVSQMEYPSSQVGSIALLRQAFYDAEWHGKYGKTPNLSLDALNQQAKQTSFFSVPDKYELFRALKIANEFKRTFIYFGSGQEYAYGTVWDTLKQQVVIPINFPTAFEAKDPYLANQIDFSDLKQWELAPSNPFVLMQSKVPFIVSANGIKSADEFWKNIHKALSRGWTVEDALRSLTTEPAKLIQVNTDYGTIESGKWANFTLYSKNPFLYNAKVLESFHQGERTVFESLPELELRGEHTLNIAGVKYLLTISGSPERLEGKVKTLGPLVDTMTVSTDTLTADAFVSSTKNDVSIQFILKKDSESYLFSLKGVMNSRVNIMEGDGFGPTGKRITWTSYLSKKAEINSEEKNAWKVDTSSIGNMYFPNMPFGFKEKPRQETIIIENVTVWTNEQDGIIQNATVIVENGKIKSVYKFGESFVKPLNAKVIDGTGKHLTSGIIDEHSHIALSKGVNESGQANTSEVRMGDCINADDIDIYRQLSGGVTAAQLLHGSANPVGGQSALIKLKWGHLPEDFLIPNAPKFVKFALGENVKQANWGDFNTVRFPQTRMGVEQVYIDGFSRAQAYHEAMKKFEALSPKQIEKTGAQPPARDLELDAMYEIVSGDRRITCHSYIQSEINMLMHVADSFGFNVNTFTHILEGYKLADKMKEHGAGCSTFADWWAYKYEVKDAIPQNASLLNEMGLVVAINSDDAEMGRRLNQEAAKVVKYGGATEEEAWKMVTLNPAKLLKIDQRTGSIKANKDADLVLWTTNPLSIEAKVLYTIIDGEILFDREADFLMQKEIAAERARILAKMNDTNSDSEPKKPVVKKRKGHFHCNTIGEEKSEGTNEH